MGSKSLPGIDRNQWKIKENMDEGGGQQPPLDQLIFFEGGFRRTYCPVVAQTQGYHLVCIWGGLVKFQGSGVVLKTILCARVRIC